MIGFVGFEMNVDAYSGTVASANRKNVRFLVSSPGIHYTYQHHVYIRDVPINYFAFYWFSVPIRMELPINSELASIFLPLKINWSICHVKPKGRMRYFKQVYIRCSRCSIESDSFICVSGCNVRMGYVGCSSEIWFFLYIYLCLSLYIYKYLQIMICMNGNVNQFNSIRKKENDREWMNEWNKEEGEQIKIHTKYCLNRTPSQWTLNSMYFISNFVFTIYLCCVYRVYLCVCGVIHWLPLILFSLYMLFDYRWRNIQKYSVSFHHWFEHTAKSWYKIANENLNDSKIK